MQLLYRQKPRLKSTIEGLPDDHRPVRCLSFPPQPPKLYHSKGKKEKAIRHFKMALEIISRLDWQDQLF